MRRVALALLLLATVAAPFAAARAMPDDDPISELRSTLGYAIGDERAALKALDEEPPDWKQAREASGSPGRGSAGFRTTRAGPSAAGS